MLSNASEPDVAPLPTDNLVRIGGRYTVDIVAVRHPLIIDASVAHAGNYIFSGYSDALENALKVAATEIAALRRQNGVVAGR